MAAVFFWFMTDKLDGDPLRTWIYALRSMVAAKRTIKNYVEKMRTVCRTVFTLAGQRNPGAFENLIDADLLGKFDAFWDYFTAIINNRIYPNVFTQSTIDR